MLDTKDPTVSWTRLASILQDFVAAWTDSDTPPDLRSFIPNDDPALASIAVPELIKVDMKHRLRVGNLQPLERYLHEFSNHMDPSDPPSDLIYEEYQLRKSAGENLNVDALYERFPQRAASLQRLLGFSTLGHSTSLADQLLLREFTVGESIDDFQLLTKLGSGAFAQVYLARQCSMQRLVALKISTQRSNEPETLAQLEHPSIIRVYDQRWVRDRKLWLLYMQFVPGGTLKEVIDALLRVPDHARDGSLLLRVVDAQLARVGLPPSSEHGSHRRLERAPWSEVVCRIGLQLASALEYAHRQGVLHRDIKPANVLLTSEGCPKLVDFNISFASELEGMNARTFFGGSLAYMSPEQLAAFDPESPVAPETLDRRSDLYSLAATLWELLYGQRPFSDDGLPGMRQQMLRELSARRQKTPLPPRSSRNRLESDLTAVLTRALQNNRDTRQEHGGEMARELWLCLEPKSRSLVELPSIGWRSLVQKYPLLSTVVVVLFPNALAGFCNYLYNRQLFVANGEAALRAFENVSIGLNIVYFTLGALLAKLVVGPIVENAKPTRTPKSDAEIIALRCRSLKLGNIAAIIGILLWLSSGLVFPLSIHWMVPEIRWQTYQQFLASMTICGLIAAAYPFYGLTFLTVRVFYPAMLKRVAGTEQDEEQLHQLERLLPTYLLTAAVVPLASMLMVVLLQIENRYVSLGLILSGLIGLGFLYAVQARVREDITALIKVVRPIEDSQNDSILKRSQ